VTQLHFVVERLQNQILDMEQVNASKADVEAREQALAAKEVAVNRRMAEHVAGIREDKKTLLVYRNGLDRREAKLTKREQAYLPAGAVG